MCYTKDIMERIDDLQYKGLKIIQNTDGFCFGVDSVLLTEFAKDMKKHSSIVDLGTGTGIIGILLSKKVEASKIIGVEVQKDVAKMAKRSIELNNLQNVMSIVNEDVQNLSLEKNSFDYVVTNPPYKKKGTGIINKEDKQIISRHETTVELDGWIKVASSLLKDNGAIYMVHRPERLNEIIEILRKYRLEPKRIRFVYPKIDKDANLVLIKAVKYANSFLKVEKPLIIYKNDGSYTDEILKIYEEGK